MSSPSALVGLRSPARYIPQLEALRGWAILLVVVFHYFGILFNGGTSGLPESAPLWLRVIAAGNTGGYAVFRAQWFFADSAVHSGDARGWTSRFCQLLQRTFASDCAALLFGSTGRLAGQSKQ